MSEGEWKYRAMIYFGVATLHFYRDDILPLTPQQTLGDFADGNAALISRVCQEAIKYMKYELSHEQIGRIIAAYLAGPVSLEPEAKS